MLSQAGRITLAQSCIMSIPTYVMQTAMLPVMVCDEIERLCRDFKWGSTPEARKHHLVGEDRYALQKRMGALGLEVLGWLTPPLT